jgi:DNA-binding NarL/FixJ family response regulator
MSGPISSGEVSQRSAGSVQSPFFNEATADQPTEEHSKPLTPRELQIAGLVGKGLRNRDIAVALSISTVTVKNHLQRIFAKLNAESRMDVMLFVLRSYPLFTEKETSNFADSMIVQAAIANGR